jgi:copper transport protein
MTDVPTLDDGTYVIAWRVVSSDGHLVQGAFTFTIGSGDANSIDVGELVGGVLSARNGAAGIDTVLVVMRWMSFVAAVVLLGALAFVVSPTIDRARLTLPALLAAIVLGATSLVHLALQGVYLTAGGWSTMFEPGAWGDVLETRLGVGLLVRVPAAAVLGIIVLTIRRDVERADDRVSSAWWQSTAALVSAVVLATFSMGGHPSAAPLAGVAVVVDVIHFAAVALWIGGLVAVLIAGRGRVDAVERLSRVATWAAPIAVATGVWQTWRIGNGWSDLVDTTWGRGLLVKSAVVIVALALGGVARLVVRQNSPSGGIGRLIITEVVVALVVLAASAYVVGESPVVARPPAVVSTTLAQGSTIVELTVTPGTVGNNEIHVVVRPPGGALQRIPSLEMRATPPSDDAVPIDVAVLGAGPNHFVGRVAFVESGNWQLDILLQSDPSSSTRLSTELAITG